MCAFGQVTLFFSAKNRVPVGGFGKLVAVSFLDLRERDMFRMGEENAVRISPAILATSS